MRRLGEEKHSAADQDDIAPGYFYAENAKQRRRKAHEPGERSQHDHAKDERKREADQARAAGFVLGEPGGEDGDENEIVDDEEDLEQRKSDERGHRVRIGQTRSS